MSLSRHLALAALPLALVLGTATAVAAEEAASYELTIRDHVFEPERLVIPAGKEVAVTVNNADATPEEFESEDLGIEKIIPGGTSAKVLVGPLEPGEYSFFGEFNMDTAQGVFVVE